MGGTFDILQPFRLIDSHPGAAVPLRLLRERLAGEVIGDADGVAMTLALDFELTIQSAGGSSTLGRSDLIAGIPLQIEAGLLMWLELDDLVVDESVVAIQGRMRMATVVDGATATTPMAAFIRIADGTMASEVVYMGTAEQESLEGLPTTEQVRALLGLAPPSTAS